MRIGYLGPEGTFTHEALLASAPEHDFEAVPLPTIYDTVMAVHEGRVDRAIAPFENSLEGSVNVTLDALALEASDVAVIGEYIQSVQHCLIAREAIELNRIEEVVSHQQASAQCAGYVREHLPQARVTAASSTAEAVKIVAGSERPWAAIGNRLAAELYGCEILDAGVEDMAGNQTRFVWLAPVGTPVTETTGSWKTSLIFWGSGSGAAGWLVRCLAEFANRDVNLTKIESRPRRQGLGSYMFFVDIEGRDSDKNVAEAIEALAAHVEQLRVLGSYQSGL